MPSPPRTRRSPGTFCRPNADSDRVVRHPVSKPRFKRFSPSQSCPFLCLHDQQPRARLVRSPASSSLRLPGCRLVRDCRLRGRPLGCRGSTRRSRREREQAAFAFEFSHRPLPQFWRDFNLAALVETISERFRDWRSSVQRPGRTADDVLRQVEAIFPDRAEDPGLQAA